MAVELDVGPSESREDVPVDVASVISRRIVTVVTKVDARPALARVVLSLLSVGPLPIGVDPQSFDPPEFVVCEQRIELLAGSGRFHERFLVHD